MPSAEGFFPKVGGDPLYASEVNRFASLNQIYDIPTLTNGLSGTALRILGSTFIPPGSLSNVINIKIMLHGTTGGVAGGEGQIPHISLSGTGFGGNIDGIGSMSTFLGNFSTKFEGVVSPSGTNIMTFHYNNIISTSSPNTIDGTSVYPNSGLVIFYKSRINEPDDSQGFTKVTLEVSRT